MLRRAAISDDGLYRYSLIRRWGRGERVLWIMLNPSRADAAIDDPTIRRCIGFTRSWGFSALEVVNLFALRAPHPRTLRTHHDATGPGNDAAIARALDRADEVIVAWGAFTWAVERALQVLDLARSRTISCVGITRAGWPRHPLYAPAALQPLPYTSDSLTLSVS